jgi:hypothetical protein
MTILPLLPRRCLATSTARTFGRRATDAAAIDSRRANARRDVDVVYRDRPGDINRRLLRQPRDGRLIVERDAVARGFPPDRAVHRAAIHVAVAELRRYDARDRAFAGARGAVNRHYQRRIWADGRDRRERLDGKDRSFSVLPILPFRLSCLRVQRNMPLWTVCKRSSLRPASHRGARASS